MTFPFNLIRHSTRLEHRAAGTTGRFGADPVVIDLSREPNLSTVDFARLLILRRRLLMDGGDLRLAGLRGRTRSVYELTRLDRALPREDAPAR